MLREEVPDQPAQGAVDLTESPEAGPRLTVQEQAEADAQRRAQQTGKYVAPGKEVLLNFDNPQQQTAEASLVTQLVTVGESG